ncbi:hypothetical protein [Sagittula salina]|uniref:Uncharacterized protein n=1 Tax=Sagittula salina TaxID=2820268 RepID=A0A940MS27_9RHOB|nr:hypothetical protein [Sagittula salina]MBP0483653.1 hypothetical protein [Sagittula salina]
MFAIQQAERGRVERLTKVHLEFWDSYHDEFTRSEKTTLVEALIGLGETERALDVWTTIDQSEMDALWQGDMDILKARILFAEGPVQDVSSARESFRDAMCHAEDLDRPVKQDTLIEKSVGVRLMNELWLGTGCDELAVFAEYLGEKLADEPMPDGIDPLRVNTSDVMDAHSMRCAGS